MVFSEYNVFHTNVISSPGTAVYSLLAVLNNLISGGSGNNGSGFTSPF